MDASIIDVTDTALWVAAIRAAEDERVDAVLRDPLAAILAGTRGRQIARAMPNRASTAWGVVVRTLAIDRLINDAVRTGVDTVLNLGAGLDTRPYRMQLPAALRWVEVDHAGIVEMKNSQLGGYPPVCILERVGMDLCDRAARREVFDRCAATSSNLLVLAEGVIPYLANDDVAVLAKELFAMPSIHAWILDFDNAGPRDLPKSWKKRMTGAPLKFQVKDWFEFFRQTGWSALNVITSAEESERIGRAYPYEFPLGLIMHALPRQLSRKILSVTGAVLMQKFRG